MQTVNDSEKKRVSPPAIKAVSDAAVTSMVNRSLALLLHGVAGTIT